MSAKQVTLLSHLLDNEEAFLRTVDATERDYKAVQHTRYDLEHCPASSRSKLINIVGTRHDMLRQRFSSSPDLHLLHPIR